MKKLILATALLAAASSTAFAEGYGKPCTAEPKEKWMTVDAIEKLVKEHGFEVRKTKIKASCAEVYVVDKQGKRQELFLDPATGNPAGSDWPSLEKKG
jgi:hypothetical protein